MADLSDVMHALRDAVAAILYPSGIPADTLPASAVGAPARVYVGWPAADLDLDLRKGVVQVSLWPRAGMSRWIGPYLDGWHSTPVTPTLTAATSGITVTFAGAGLAPNMIAAVIVDHTAVYTYPVLETDGPSGVAAALAALISVDRSAGATGGVLTVPRAFSLVGRVVSGATEHREIRRLSQSVQITAWCPTQALRDLVIRLIDDFLIEEVRTLLMPDGTLATVTYEGTAYDEEARQQPLHRRDLIVSVEYSQTRSRQSPAIAVPVVQNIDADSIIRKITIV